MTGHKREFFKTAVEMFAGKKSCIRGLWHWPENLAQISYVSHVGHSRTNRPSSWKKKAATKDLP